MGNVATINLGHLIEQLSPLEVVVVAGVIHWLLTDREEALLRFEQALKREIEARAKVPC
jgi:hypothetical protein